MKKVLISILLVLCSYKINGAYGPFITPKKLSEDQRKELKELVNWQSQINPIANSTFCYGFFSITPEFEGKYFYPSNPTPEELIELRQIREELNRLRKLYVKQTLCEIISK